MHKVFKKDVLELLDSLDPEEMAKHSSLNHHVNGMDYLCLMRQPEGVTYKIYVMEKPYNPNSGFLVNPHSHRYEFVTHVLAGKVQNIRFKKRDTHDGLLYRARDWTECQYDPLQGHTALGTTYLRPSQIEYAERGDSYRLEVDEIHTLRTYDDGAPLVLGLLQFKDTKEHSRLYLPTAEYPRMNRPITIRPMARQIDALRDRVLTLIGRGT